MTAARLAALAVLVASLAFGPASAQRHDVRIGVSEGQLVRLPRNAGTILLADPSIADIQTPSPGTFYLFGKKPGRTSLIVLDANGAQLGNWRITVAYSDEELRSLLRAEVGNYPVSLAYTPAGAVLSGRVPTPQVGERVRAIAARYVGDGQALVNNLVVAGSVQVNLRVRVAEVSRTVSKSLGFDWNAVGTLGNFAVGLATGRAAIDVAGAVVRGVTGTGSLSGGFRDRRGSGVNVTLDALAAEGLVRLLAEPNLVSTSGEPASFIAGGQFPVPVAQGLDRISVEYRSFGVALKFTPTVLSDDLVSLRVQPEVSELSDVGRVTANGFDIPGVTLRQADTTVELGSGQSFAIAGLIRDNFSTTLNRFPGLGDIPILGPLFRSSSFRREETELVIIVTPYIVRPSASPVALRAPGEAVAAPGDVELLLGGRLTGQGRLRPDVSTRLRGDVGFILE